MIYLKNISTSQEVFIPKCSDANGVLTLVLKNTVDLVAFEQDVEDANTSELYFKVNIELPTDIASGEYEYSLMDDAGVISTGLLVVGESFSPTEYNKTIQYEQY